VNGAEEKKLTLDPRCTPLATNKRGPFVVLGDGSLMVFEGNTTRTSTDDGKTWSEPREIYTGPQPGRPLGNIKSLRTADGVIVLVYMDGENQTWSWNDDTQEAGDDCRLDVWAIRSLDDGKTWIDRQMIFQGYCGALIDIIETADGHIVVPVQRMLLNHTRHAQCTYVSADKGATWQVSNIIDLGGHGDHDGAYEATLVELTDGRLWMLLRTNWKRFWEAFSDDHGISWRVIQPTDIDASSAPGHLVRLASGRLILAWNRLFPEGKTTTHMWGENRFCEVMASMHRQELAIAFSQDDGKTWTDPEVIARVTENTITCAYPYVFERRAGELWIITHHGQNVGASIKESDFVGA